MAGRTSKYFQIVFICLVIQNVYLVPEDLFSRSKEIGSLFKPLNRYTCFKFKPKYSFSCCPEDGSIRRLISMLITKALNMLVVSTITLWNIHYSFSWEKLKRNSEVWDAFNASGSGHVHYAFFG